MGSLARGRGPRSAGRALALGAVGEYQLQAAIAAVHDRAATAADTDWAEILTLYGILEEVTGNPVVTLNRAVAVAMARGPRAALEVVDAVEDRLGTTHRWLAVRGQLLEMAGETAAAADLLDRAAATATNEAERRHLAARAAAFGLRESPAEDEARPPRGSHDRDVPVVRRQEEPSCSSASPRSRTPARVPPLAVAGERGPDWTAVDLADVALGLAVVALEGSRRVAARAGFVVRPAVGARLGVGRRRSASARAPAGRRRRRAGRAAAAARRATRVRRGPATGSPARRRAAGARRPQPRWCTEHVDLDAMVAGVDVDAVVARVDLERIIDRIDVDAVVARADLQAVLGRVDVDDVVARVDLERIIDRIDVDAVVARADLQAVLGRVDVDDVVARVDLERIIDRIDVDAVVGRADLDAVVAKLDLIALAEYVVEGIDLPGIIRSSTGSMASEGLREVRRQGIGADERVAHVVDRLLHRPERAPGSTYEEGAPGPAVPPHGPARVRSG